MNLFVAILAANSITLVFTVVAAIKRPILSNKLIVAAAVCVTGSALHQVFTGRGDGFTLPLTAILVVLMMRRIALNLGGVPSRRKRR